MTMIVIATVSPIPQYRAEVIAAIETAIEQVHAEEDDCLLYALHEAPDRLVMIEKYASNEAMAAHRAVAGLANLVKTLDGKLSIPMDVQILSPHPAGSLQKGAL